MQVEVSANLLINLNSLFKSIFQFHDYITNYHVQFANDLYLTLGKERLKVV